MLSKRLLLAFFLFSNVFPMYANQIDIGIFESVTPNKIEIKIRPDFNIVPPQTITALLYTVRWDDPSISITPEYVYPFNLAPQGDPEEYNGYFYLTFAATPFNSIPMSAGQEYIVSAFTFTNGDCETFEIIEDEWTQSNNGNVYLEFIGAEVTGIIYQPSVQLGSIGGYITGNDTIYLGNSTGTLNLMDFNGNVLTWQRKIDENPWTDIPGSLGLTAYSEIPSTAGTYAYQVLVQYGTCPVVLSEPIFIEVILAEETELSLKVFLEGPFTGSEMNTGLNQQGYIPLYQPYSVAPWNYSGTEYVTSIPNTDVVDWILIELRETSGDVSTATSDARIARQAGFLLKNGEVVGTDGFNNLTFNANIADNLYVVVWHRNHLSVISSIPINLSGIVYNYDFTNGEAKVYGGSLGHKEIAAGSWGMIAGDGSKDREINNRDKNDIWIIQQGLSGYFEGDFNMDGQVDDSDKNDFWDSNTGKGSQVPD